METEDEYADFLGFDGVLKNAESGGELLALERLDEILAEMPGNVRVRMNQALIKIILGEADDAEAILLAIKEDDPLNISVLYILARFYLVEKRYADVEEILAEISAFGREEDRANIAYLSKQAGERKESDIKYVNREKILDSTVTFSGSYSTFDSVQFNYFATDSYGVNVRYSRPLPGMGSLSLGYRYKQAVNLHEYGKDYAKRVNTFDAGFAGPFLAEKVKGLTASIGGSFGLETYSNYDSNAKYMMNYLKKRIIGAFSVNGGLNYRAHEKLSFSFNVIRNWNISNLPAGFIFADSLGRGRPVGRQPASLEDNGFFNASLGMNFTF